LGIFWPNEDRNLGKTKFLHNGVFPCYSLYKTKDDKYIALAAVEEKFWLRFCEVFQIHTQLDRFYNQDQTLFNMLANIIGNLTQSEIAKLSESEDICLSVID
jgi:crotonobetainyl-CoA:carnitine CoA-transferase CaiB-like acyl-CoA transferase